MNTKAGKNWKVHVFFQTRPCEVYTKTRRNNGNYLIPYHIKSFLVGLASIFKVFIFYFSSGSMIGNINSNALFPSFEVSYGSSFPLKTFSFFEILWKTYSLTYSPFLFLKIWSNRLPWMKDIAWCYHSKYYLLLRIA